MFNFVMTRVTLALGLVLVLAVPPPTTHAIPVPGDYTINGALLGSFHSDGSTITTWHFTHIGVPDVWASTIPFNTTSQTAFFFQTGYGFPEPPRALDISWLKAVNHDGDQVTVDGFPFNMPHFQGTAIITSTASPVPEPSTAILLLGGLGLLVAYGLRQRRTAELQVG